MVWHISPFCLDMRTIPGESLIEWWSSLLERWKGADESKQFWAAVGSIIWRLWMCRNGVVFNDYLERPDIVCQAAVRDAADFITANEKIGQHEELGHGDIGSGVWERPPIDCFKINFDGGIDKNRGVCGLGMVIRDWRGSFAAARAIQKQHVEDPLMAEALAAREGLQLVAELGLGNITLEGDSQQLIRLIQRQMEDHHTVGVVVADILHLLAGILGVNTGFVKRSGNGVAHNVAQRAVRGPVFSTWEFRSPSWLLSSLQKDGCPA